MSVLEDMIEQDRVVQAEVVSLRTRAETAEARVQRPRKALEDADVALKTIRDRAIHDSHAPIHSLAFCAIRDLYYATREIGNA